MKRLRSHLFEKRPAPRQARVAVLGGGVAGLTAAQELIERGFDVQVVEARECFGGKARSMGAPGTGRQGRADLPGEHGFRFFPGFYRHLDDTLARIPFGLNPRGVLDNLVEVARTEVHLSQGPARWMSSRFPRSLDEVGLLLRSLSVFEDIAQDELLFFSKRLALLVASCHERRLREYETCSWWDFLHAPRCSERYRTLLAHGLTQVLVAMSPRDASARTVGNTLVQLYAGILLPGGAADRVLDGPTSERWVDPWVAYLQACGVRFTSGTHVRQLHREGERLTHVTVEDASGLWELRADHYVVALPVHVLARLLTPEMLEAAPGLAGLSRLRTEWMVGLQYYLRRDAGLGSGHGMFPDSPWALTTISQGRYWKQGPSRYGDGTVQAVLSVDISDWDTPGLRSGRPARLARSREEIAEEVWAQLKVCLNRPGDTVLRDEDRVGWHLDPSITFGPDGLPANEEPLMVNTRGSWQWRPEAVTELANLFLAGDFVRTHTDLVSMEGANEAARRAVNGLLAAAGVSALPCKVWPLQEPAVFAPLRAVDQVRLARGLPHVWAEPGAVPDFEVEVPQVPARQAPRRPSATG